MGEWIIEVDTEWLGPGMFLGALIFLAFGYPVAFALGGVGILFGLIGIGLGVFDWNLFTALPDRFFGTMSNYTLLAIPYFIFLGAMLEKRASPNACWKPWGLSSDDCEEDWP